MKKNGVQINAKEMSWLSGLLCCSDKCISSLFPFCRNIYGVRVSVALYAFFMQLSKGICVQLLSTYSDNYIPKTL